MSVTFEERIKADFKINGITLAHELNHYFIFQHFDEWQEIKNDICEGYDDCCSKEILIKVLNLKTMTDKISAYETLKLCALSIQTAQENETSKAVNQIKMDMFKTFCQTHNVKLAEIISESFNDVIVLKINNFTKKK
eukprot:303348_1